MKNLICREAQDQDIKAIAKIHNALALSQVSNYEQGFLLKETSQSLIIDHLASSINYLVAHQNNSSEIMGFIRFSKGKIEKSFLKTITFENPHIEEKILSPNHIYIEIIAVNPDFIGQKVGQFMYKTLFNKFPHCYFSAFVVNKPISNQRSLNFHLKQGFNIIGKLNCEKFLELHNYESLLMFKEN
jgi:L-amino acid N-acyltransferase YncA